MGFTDNIKLIIPRSLYFFYNLAPTFFTFFSIVALSGVGIFRSPGSFPSFDQTKYYMTAIFSWINIMLLCVLTLQYLIRLLLAKPGRDWWSLSLLLEALKENFWFKKIFFAVGLILAIVNIVNWSLCYHFDTKYQYCVLQFVPFSSTSAPRDYIRHMASEFTELKCENFEMDQSTADLMDSFSPAQEAEQIRQGRTLQDPVDLQTYERLMRTCFDIAYECKPYCSALTRPSGMSFAFALVLSLFGLYSIISYDGAYHHNMPSDYRVFNKLALPFKAKFVPVFWKSSADIIVFLPTMTQLYLGCKGNVDHIAKTKTRNAHLPWDWMEKLDKQDYQELQAIFDPKRLSQLCGIYELEGPLKYLVEPLLKWFDCKSIPHQELYNNSTYVYIAKLKFKKQPKTTQKVADEMSSKMSVIIYCWSETFVRKMPLTKSEVMSVLGGLHSSVQLKPSQSSKFTSRVVGEYWSPVDKEQILKEKAKLCHL